MPVQNHIHLGPSIGGAPENAPIWKWRIRERQEERRGFVTIEETDSGYMKYYVLKEAGEPVILTNYVYELVLDNEDGYTREDRHMQLKSMLYKIVYLVDVVHEDDGTNHTSSVKPVFLSEIGSPERINNLLVKEYVEVKLMDATRM